MTKKIRPTVRFGENQYKLIQARLDEKGISFQQYCLELICNDLDIPIREFEDVEGQMSLFDDDVA